MIGTIAIVLIHTPINRSVDSGTDKFDSIKCPYYAVFEVNIIQVYY